MALKKLLAVVLSIEMACILFVFSGRIKAIWSSSFLGVDLTLLFGLVLAGVIAYGLNTSKLSLSLASKTAPVSALLLVVYLATSLAWSPVSAYSLHKFGYLLTIVPMAYLGGLICGSSPKRLYRLLLALVLFTVVYLITASGVSGGLGALVNQDLITILNIRSEDARSLYQQNSNLTALAGAGCMLLIYLNRSRPAYAIFYFCLMVALVALTLNLGGRAGILRLVVAGLVLVLFSGRLRILKLLILFAIAILVFFLIAAYTHFLIELAAWEYLPDSIARLITITLETNLMEGGEARVGLGMAAIYIWLDNPIVGAGLGGYPSAANLAWEFGYPHNIILEILAETGLIGVSLFLFFLYTHAAVVVKSLISNPEDRASLVKLLIFAVSFSVSMFSSDLTDREYPFFIGILAASVLGSRVVAKKQHDNRV